MTDRFMTVLTFTYPHELAIVRGRLESEGIECFVADELTAQVNPFYSNAIGGVKLQVRESDIERATEILKESGYIKEEKDIQQSPVFFVKLDKVTSRWPLIKKLPLFFRLMIIIAVLSGLLITVVYFASLPALVDK